MIAFCKNVFLKHIIGITTIDKKIKNIYSNQNSGEKKTLYTAQPACCKQKIRSSTFKSSQTNEG